MQKMSVFDIKQKVEEATKVTEIPTTESVATASTQKGFLYRETPDDGDIYLLVDNASEVVGGYLNQFIGTNAVGKPVFRHHMLMPDELSQNDPRIKGKKNVLAVYVLAIKNLYYFNEDREKAIDLFFKDEASMKYYVSLLAKLIKQRKI